jgi:hypothetical protein
LDAEVAVAVYYDHGASLAVFTTTIHARAMVSVMVVVADGRSKINMLLA